MSRRSFLQSFHGPSEAARVRLHHQRKREARELRRLGMSMWRPAELLGEDSDVSEASDVESFASDSSAASERPAAEGRRANGGRARSVSVMLPAGSPELRPGLRLSFAPVRASSAADRLRSVPSLLTMKPDHIAEEHASDVRWGQPDEASSGAQPEHSTATSVGPSSLPFLQPAPSAVVRRSRSASARFKSAGVSVARTSLRRSSASPGMLRADLLVRRHAQADIAAQRRARTADPGKRVSMPRATAFAKRLAKLRSGAAADAGKLQSVRKGVKRSAKQLDKVRAPSGKLASASAGMLVGCPGTSHARGARVYGAIGTGTGSHKPAHASTSQVVRSTIAEEGAGAPPVSKAPERGSSMAAAARMDEDAALGADASPSGQRQLSEASQRLIDRAAELLAQPRAAGVPHVAAPERTGSGLRSSEQFGVRGSTPPVVRGTELVSGCRSTGSSARGGGAGGAVDGTGHEQAREHPEQASAKA
jgi:hypothetical protein